MDGSVEIGFRDWWIGKGDIPRGDKGGLIGNWIIELLRTRGIGGMGFYFELVGKVAPHDWWGDGQFVASVRLVKESRPSGDRLGEKCELGVV
jgi:hypothetical protein